MGFENDKELQEYRNVMQPPEADGFEDGFNWKAVVGALFHGFSCQSCNRLSYLWSSVLTPGMGGAMKWVMIIFFAEVARRSFTKVEDAGTLCLEFHGRCGSGRSVLRLPF
jgi:hypothetical protein